jgi:hypothetical protein
MSIYEQARTTIALEQLAITLYDQHMPEHRIGWGELESSARDIYRREATLLVQENNNFTGMLQREQTRAMARHQAIKDDESEG